MIWARLWGSLLQPSRKEIHLDFSKSILHSSFKIYYLTVRIVNVSRQLLKIVNHQFCHFSCCWLLLLIETFELKLVLVLLLTPLLSISTPVLQFMEQLKFCEEEGPAEPELIGDVELSVELKEELVLVWSSPTWLLFVIVELELMLELTITLLILIFSQCISKYVFNLEIWFFSLSPPLCTFGIFPEFNLIKICPTVDSGQIDHLHSVSLSLAFGPSVGCQ